MDVNSKDGKSNVITRVPFGEGKPSPAYVHRSLHSAELFKSDPAKYWYFEAKREELELKYEEAADKYTAAYSFALKAGRSCAVRYMWEAMRCIEFSAIYKDLLAEWGKTHQQGKLLEDGGVVTHWHNEKDVVPTAILSAYKAKLPTGFPYNLLVWNEANKTIRFIHSTGFFADSEPLLEREYVVHPEGWMETKICKPDPEVLLDKWMLSSEKSCTFDRKIAIRRSIKIRYLDIPDDVKAKMSVRSIWAKYVVPAIGNRSIGHLHDDFKRIHGK